MNARLAPPVAPVHGLSLWAGVLGAPAAWALHLQLTYALVPWACHHDRQIVLHALTLLLLLIAAGAGYVSWLNWRAMDGGSPDPTDGGPLMRTRFLSAMGIATGALGALLIVAGGARVDLLQPVLELKRFA